VYTVSGLNGTTPVDVQVALLGYQPAVAKGIAAGQGGCATPKAAVNATVKLQPQIIYDAGSDADAH
jgi:hypothetical protein